MTKVKRITVQNLKALSAYTADFNGCTALITGRNNSGKTSFLRSEFDRFRGSKPELILKQGETEGFSELELTTGEKLRWEFSNKNEKGFKEKMTFTSHDNISTSMTVALRDKYCPATFDVDKFLADQPKQQRITLQKLAGLDFTAVDLAYKTAYDDRESKNRDAKNLAAKLKGVPVPAKVDPVELAELNEAKQKEADRLAELYKTNHQTNKDLRQKWNDDCDKLRTEVSDWNALQLAKGDKYQLCQRLAGQLNAEGYTDESLNKFLDALKQDIEEVKVFEPLPEPTYIDELPDQTAMNNILQQITDAVQTNTDAKAYTDYLKLKQQSTDANTAAADADKKVQDAEKARMDLIKSAKLPEGFGFSEDGITYNDLPFTREQLSSSGIYIAALKLAAMTLGEVKTLHFDASFLDKNSLADIEKWADAEGLQLLIERPDFEGGEITYELLCN